MCCSQANTLAHDFEIYDCNTGPHDKIGPILLSFLFGWASLIGEQKTHIDRIVSIIHFRWHCINTHNLNTIKKSLLMGKLLETSENVVQNDVKIDK